MRPLMSYYGGKQRMAQRILDALPRHTVYVEPFCGGAAVLFAKPKPPVTNAHHYREVLNDSNERIMTVYRVAQIPHLRDALLDRLAYTPYSRAEHLWRLDRSAGMRPELLALFQATPTSTLPLFEGGA